MSLSDPHKILREVLRNYLTFQDYVSSSGQSVITYKEFDISFYDLRDCLANLSPRKKEAIYYNVILDMLQRDVAEIMGITTVSVGQYVDLGIQQISEAYFTQEELKNGSTKLSRKQRVRSE